MKRELYILRHDKSGEIQLMEKSRYRKEMMKWIIHNPIKSVKAFLEGVKRGYYDGKRS